jgi:hypothetical protein
MGNECQVMRKSKSILSQRRKVAKEKQEYGKEEQETMLESRSWRSLRLE